jgi:hypothetical protein
VEITKKVAMIFGPLPHQKATQVVYSAKLRYARAAKAYSIMFWSLHGYIVLECVSSVMLFRVMTLMLRHG